MLSLSPPCQMIKESVFLMGGTHSSALNSKLLRTIQKIAKVIHRSDFNFLQREYTTYSESACIIDYIYTSMADNCDCIGARSFYSPDTAYYSQLPNCTLEKVCCVVSELISLSDCNCPVACSSISYDMDSVLLLLSS